MIGTLVLGLIGWALLAPPSLGGKTGFAVVSGSSMEPGLRGGDLVVLRERARYEVGDVVGYRDARLGKVVLHRIVAEADGRFVTKGDNNDFRDPTHPAPADIVGARSLRVPAIGHVLAWAARPFPAAFLIGGIMLVPFGAGARRRRRRDGADRPGRVRAAGPGDRGASEGFVLALAGAALGLGLLGAWWAQTPAHEIVRADGAYQESGTFSYRARATAGAAYPDGVVRSGDAIFIRLVSGVKVRFDYRVSSPAPLEAAGRVRMDAVIADGLGWTRRLSLRGSRRFEGPTATVSGTLPLRRIRALIERFEAQTGTDSAGYSVQIVPRVALEGLIDGQPIATTYAPALDLRLDRTRLASSAAVPGVGDAEVGDPLEPQRAGAVSRAEAAPVSLLGLDLDRTAALWGSAALALACLVAGVMAGMRLLAARRGPERDLIRMRLGHRLVRVTGLPELAADRIVPVESIEDLVRIADGAERPILVLEGEGPARYALEEGGLTYRYDERPPSVPALPEPATAGPDG